MKVDNHLYKAGILIRAGEILAVSLEDLDKGREDYGEGILDQIKDMTKEGRGDVDVYSFEETAMELAVRSNMHLMFRTPLDLIRLVKTKEEFDEIKEDRELAELEVEEEPDTGGVKESREAEGKKPEEKKPEEKKAEEKKPEGKKAEGKKAEEKKPEEKKPEGKKAEEKKAEGKKAEEKKPEEKKAEGKKA
ncbi:MAG: hypothetical protein U9M95_05860, partial [Candidatus Altiarchaeota archaeon]|nr:hypothetical protein [Candidatus Altiarchaeota archaeon]